MGSQILLNVGGPTTISGAISDNGGGYALLKTGAQTLTLSNAGNNYGGGTFVDQGTAQLGITNALPTSGTLTLGYGGVSAGSLSGGAPGTFDLNGFNQTLGGLVNSGTGISTIGNSSTTSNSTLTFAAGATPSTFGGIIVDHLGSGTETTALTVSSGTLTLTAASTYSGTTSVTGGALNVTGSLNGSTSVTVANALLEGKGYIADGVTIGSGSGSAGSAVIEPGSVGATGTFTLGSALTLNSDAKFIFTLNSTGGGVGTSSSELIASSVSLNSSAEFTFQDIASTPGTLTQGTVFTAISTGIGGLSGTFGNLPNDDVFAANGNLYEAAYTSDSLTLTVVPEPGTWGMILSGFGMLICIQKLRKRQIGV
jgi:autotransporter-associated beta strand protein